MEQKRSLDDVLKCAKAGRTISPTYAGRLMHDFYRLPLDKLSEMDKQYRKDLKDILLENLKVMPRARSYAELIESYYNRIYENGEQEYELDVFFALALVGYNRSKNNKMFSLSVQDYMEAAGADELYDIWFTNDVSAWEKAHNGKAPTIGTVLRECIGIIGNSNIHFGDGEMVTVFNYCDRVLANKSVDKISNAFRRDADGDDPYIWTSLAATWVWILMIEIPHMMVDNAKTG